MICSSPIVVKNSKIAFRTGIDKPYLSLPCGKCLACRYNMQEEWCIRAYYHWLHTKQLHGKTIFVTFTYNESHLPRIIEDGFNFPCFNKKDIDRFLNSFRQHFKRKFGIGDNGTLGIDYLVCSEYGQRNTRRSHYHALLFIPNCDDISVSYIKKRIKFYWEDKRKIGFVRFSKVSKGGALVRSHKCIQYVSKYITKDLNFYEKEDIQEYLSIEGNADKIKHNLPRHWQSKGFGLYLVDFINSLPNDKKFWILRHGINLPYEAYRYTLPRYISNKIYYDTKKTDFVLDYSPTGMPVYRSVRILSSFGYDFRNRTYFDSFREKLERLDLDLSNIGLRKYFKDELDLNEFMCELGDNPYNDFDFLKLQRHLESYLRGHTLYDLVAYEMVYRGFENSALLELDRLDIDYLTYSAPRVYALRNEYLFSDVPDSSNGDQPEFVGKFPQFRDLVPAYSRFEYVLSFLEKAKSRISGRKSEAKEKKLKSSKYLTETLLGY